MATLSEKLVLAIAAQQGEVTRMTDVAKSDLPLAQARLRQLQGLLDQVKANPDIEAGYAVAKNLGIRLDSE